MADKLFTGWMRTGWRHWYEVAASDDPDELWAHLRNARSKDVDGELLVLPYGERPDRIETKPTAEN